MDVISDMEKLEVRFEGYRARITSGSRPENPHANGTAKAFYWRTGWGEADRELNASGLIARPAGGFNSRARTAAR
jgi:hypothetical protein